MFKGRSIHSVIGVDLTGSEIRFVEAKGKAVSPQLLHHGSSLVEDQLFLEGVLEDVDGFTRQLEPCLSRCFSKHVILCLPDERIQVLTLSLEQNLSTEDLEDNLSIALERKLNYPLEDAYFDYALLGSNSDDDSLNNYQVIACKSTIVDSLVDGFNRLGYQVQQISYRGSVLTNFLQRLMQKEKITERAALFINTSTFSQLIIADTQQRYFCDTLNAADATQNLQALLDLAQSELHELNLTTLWTQGIGTIPTTTLLTNTNIIALDLSVLYQTQQTLQEPNTYLLALALAQEGLQK